MRSFLAIVLILTAVVASLWVWGMGHPHRMAASSSQIFIHGTPVCVTQRGGEIEAAVGVCGNFSGNPHRDSEGHHGGPPTQKNPHGVLPPGHPPVDDGSVQGPEAGRRTPI